MKTTLIKNKVMIREEDIQKAKDATFPIPEGGRSYEQALAANGFELGAHFVLNRLKSDGYSDETHWKPSDEQMDALLVKIPIENSCNKVDNILKSLYSDLKKLK